MDDPRIIFHVDLDAYYASIATRNNPKLIGIPVIVGPDPRKHNGRGVVITCTYEARKFGIRSGMPVAQANQLCPEAEYVRVDRNEIRETSQRIHRLLEGFAGQGLYQAGGCDEGYLDVTRRVDEHNSPENYARDIQQAVFAQERLSCSIGIGPNKLIAKMASDFRKPGGITRIAPNAVLDFLSPLPVRKIVGVGPKTEERLRRLGILKVADIRDSQPFLRKTLGHRFAEWLIRASLGQGSNAVRSSKGDFFNHRQSIGHERTKRFSDWDEIAEAIRTMTLDNCQRARRHNLSFRTVTIKLRFTNFNTHTKSTTFIHQTTSSQKALNAAIALLESFRAKNEQQKIRLAGSRLSGLQKRNKPLTEWIQRKCEILDA
ncbi:MAG: DNA polymerase IV [Candidatus Hodarchaeales archaeon]